MMDFAFLYRFMRANVSNSAPLKKLNKVLLPAPVAPIKIIT